MVSRPLKEEAVIHWFKSESVFASVLGLWGRSKVAASENALKHFCEDSECPKRKAKYMHAFSPG